MNIVNILLVGVGGGIGSITRYLAVMSIDKKLNSLFPFGTATVNIAGSFFLGLIVAILLKKTGTHPEAWRFFLVTGFCGGFTTFSAFAGENLNLLQQKFAATALLYISVSVIGALLAVWAGFSIGRNLF